MTTCQACGSEIAGPDRFCRSCGAPIASLVGDLDDTLRFNPSRRLATVEPQAATNPFYVAPNPNAVAHEHEAPPDGKGPSWFTSLLARIRLLPHNLLWVGFLVLLVLTASAGVTIGRGVLAARRAERYRRAERAREAAAKAKEHRAAQAAAAEKVLTEAVQNALGFVPAEVPADAYPDLQGVFVQSLTSDSSPAALARIQAGDVLTGLNGKPITSLSDLRDTIKVLAAGSEVEAKVSRDGDSVDARVKIADAAHAPFKPSVDLKEQGFFGIGDVGRRCCVPGSRVWGLEIHRIVDNSPADLIGLQTGDVIVEFDGHQVRTPDELARRIRAARPRSKVQIRFYRGDTLQTVEAIVGHGSE